ncbi:hypothetical protein RFI_30410 [Reticulomyxa filosa]|uniref:Uncharacterized protein n=1 Tax=Reticulomyxa filosa TaxID=46433 RepID=X6M0Q3_RETFI|nr:hypothetical protein RFI_30410 [Reticulomyxa filosa]|eukprot:ETO06982.1 hypothetical protein RFI_30410 [Reticulomyxa filosa]
MEQEQQLAELKEALDLKTRQLNLYRQNHHSNDNNNQHNDNNNNSNNDNNNNNNNNNSNNIVLPIHLRPKFSEFLQKLLTYQRQHFAQALNNFVQSIDPKTLPSHITKQHLFAELIKIGNSLTVDYVSELELRLNGSFQIQPKFMVFFLKKKKGEGK